VSNIACIMHNKLTFDSGKTDKTHLAQE